MVTKTDKSCALVFHCGFFSEVGGELGFFWGTSSWFLPENLKENKSF